MNAYFGVKPFRARGSVTIPRAAEWDVAIRQVIEACSRLAEGVCSRKFYTESDVRIFDGSGKSYLYLSGDLASINSVKIDADGDDVYEKTLALTDYWTWPTNGGPIWRLDMNTKIGTESTWPKGKRTVQIDGKWGFEIVLEPTGATVDDNPLSNVATSAVFNVTDPSYISAGDTLLIDTEQVYVLAAFDQAGKVSTLIQRGVNGTTAAQHIQNAVVSRYVYPDVVRESTYIQALRVWKRRESSYATSLALPEFSTIGIIQAGLDPDVKVMLEMSDVAWHGGVI